MRCALREYPARGVSDCRIVELAESVDQENVENVSRSARGGRSGAGMKLLRNLFSETQAADR